MSVVSFAAFKAARRVSTDPWCGSCSDAAGERQYLMAHLHRLGFGKSETRWHCPECGSEFT